MYKLAITACVVLSIIGCTTPARVQIPPVEPRTAYASTMHPKVILVLGSGSARGFAHAGVLKALEKNHIHIDMIVGTSAGSIVGALYAGNPHADSLEKLLITTPKNQVIQFSPFNIFSGPFSGDKLQNYLIANIKATSFDQLAIPLVVVATDLETGNSHAFSSGPIAPAVNASSAAPPYFKPVALYGKTYIDGGFVDPVAVDIARSYHPKVIIAVDLSPVLSAQSPKTNPSLFLRGFEIMLTQLAKRSAQGADVVIHPHLDDISMFEGVGREQSISAGYSAAMEKMPAIRDLILKEKVNR